ncbi:MAG: phenylalanine--tRNA ligase subunit beta [Nanoarchaeota archaeon]|nr:phenylalanine--tRNA ligase subunit beta [Nanoarchaeota archaeon]
MPTITLNRKVLEKAIGKALPEEELKERISMLGTDLESVTKDEIVVEIFPNRPDLLSDPGFARAFKSFLGVETGLKQYKVEKPKHKMVIDPSVKDVRPWSACAIVTGLKLDDEKIREIIQIQEKLHVTFGRNRKKVAIGIYPLEKITMPITFKALPPQQISFRPLESTKEMTAKEILETHPTGKEYAHLLAGKTRYPLFVDAKDKILSLPPIINSYDVGKVTEKTTTVFIECSGSAYDAQAKCLNMIVCALADMGGQIHAMDIEAYGKKLVSPDLTPSEQLIDIAYVNKILGLDLKEKDVKELLARMGYGYEKGKALVPAYRADILHPLDLVEDIAIAYGFENFTEELPQVATIGEEHKENVLKRNVGEILAGLGFLECAPTILTSKETQNTKMLAKESLIELSNSVNQEYDVLPAWGIPTLVELFQRNRQYEYPQFLFTMLPTFAKGQTETGIAETQKLVVGVADEKADYTKARQVLDYLMRMVGKEITIEKTEHPSFIPGRVAKILVGKKEAGLIGELHPQVLENWQLIMPVAVFELDINLLF